MNGNPCDSPWKLHPQRQAHAELQLDRGMSWERAKEVRKTSGNVGSAQHKRGGLYNLACQNLQNSEILLNFEGCASLGPDMRVEVVECDHNVVNLSNFDLLHPQLCLNM